MDSLVIGEDERVRVLVQKLSAGYSGFNDYESGSLRILDQISFDLESGQLLALLGASGSGKTTLLNTLSGRLTSNTSLMSFEGSIDYKTSGNHKKVRNGYLAQDDVFITGLTLVEILRFQADLKMPSYVKPKEKNSIIELLLEVLELEHLRDTTVFSFKRASSLSGGEQRRLSLAIQLLNKPSVLFLDEPTTGLDSGSSLKLIQVLKKLASPQFGITIILSIHQPRVEVTSLFDQICVLTNGGRMVYYGTLAYMTDYFNSIDFITNRRTQKYSSFIDYVMELSVKDSTTLANEGISTNRINKLVHRWKEHSVSTSKVMEIEDGLRGLDKLAKSNKDRISFPKELWILTRRSLIIASRDTQSLVALNGGSLLLAICFGWLFYKPHPDLAGIRSITSGLYVMMEVVGFSPMFLELERLWSTDGLTFFREYQENDVSIAGFIFSRGMSRFPLEDFPVGAIFAVITYFMWGLRGGVAHFFVYFLLVVLTSIIGKAVALVCFAVGNDFAISALLLNILYQVQNSACGYFVNAKTMPKYVRWVKYLSYFWYNFGALTANQFTNWTGDCPYQDERRCLEFTGNYQLTILGYPQDWTGVPVMTMLVWLVLLYGFMYVGLRYRSYDFAISGTKPNRLGSAEIAQEYFNEKLSSTSSELSEMEEGHLDICLKNVYLTSKRKTLLTDVSAEFKCSSLNAIMGPSGAGKTTLLKFISNRLSKSRKFECSGDILINGHHSISAKELSEISCYVAQNDNTLIPTLTVRETLYFQARLRLESSEHHEIPQIVNSLIRKTGLMDCADTVIGSALVKGISGGEKRRVSIASQLLSDPKVLFLDEPTSGLDSTTALSILQLLKSLALSNQTTIILTIHQPNEQIAKQFETLLLLAGKGRVVYSGEACGLRRYLSLIGYSCTAKNVINYALDLISKGIDENDSHLSARVDLLLAKWNASVGNIRMAELKAIPSTFTTSEYIKTKAPFMLTLVTLVQRQFLNTIRSFDILFSRMVQTILLGLIHTLFFAPLRHNTEGINDRLGVIQEVLNLYFVGFINNVALYPIEKEIFYQEYKDGIYGVLQFNLSYLLNELPTEIISTVIFSLLIVFGVGLPRNLSMFLTMLLSSFAAVNCGESLGIIVNSIFNHMGMVANVLSAITTIAIFMAGTMSLHMPRFFRAWNYLNPMKYAAGVCIKLGFKDQSFDCGSDYCVLKTGQDVLTNYHLDNDLKVYFGALVACIFIFRILGVIAVYTRVRFFI